MLDVTGFEKYAPIIQLFEKISDIPRPSGHTDAISDFLVTFARERGLEYSRDSHNNVIIRKPATSGQEHRAGIILQGHTDIVAETDAECKKDMTREGLDLYRDGEFLRARGTTLGADDGVAVAYALAVLDGAVERHPYVEALFTSDEETGLVGAEALDGSLLHARRLINIDSDEEGVFTVGCAGGMQVRVSLPINRCNHAGYRYKLSVSGLLGGHSGCDINLGRENAVRILAEAMSSFPGARIVSLSGGNKDNAIPRSAECIFLSKAPIDTGACGIFDKILDKYLPVEPHLLIEIGECDGDGIPLDPISSERVCELISSLPNGVIKMSEVLSGQVETSLNLGAANLTGEELLLSYYLRSSRLGATDELYLKMRDISISLGAIATSTSSYPAWEYSGSSPLCDTLVKLYREEYRKEPVVNTIHAGLECGIIAAKVEGLDCISIGPDNHCLHTTEEHLSLPSFCRVWDFLVRILETI